MGIFSKTRLFFLIFIAVAIASCIKIKQYPPVPVIEFKNFIQYKHDSADMIIDFKDGDGNIGLNQGDTLPPYNAGVITYYNYIMTYFYKGKDNLFHPFDKDSSTPAIDTLMFNYRIPYITPIGQDKVLDGEIKVSLKAPYFIPGHKEIKYEIYIFDRSLHKSNVLTTPTYTVSP